MAVNILCHPTLQQVEDDSFKKQTQMLQFLTCIWNKVGFDEDQKVTRASEVWKHVLDLLQEILDEESGLCENIKGLIKTYEIKISGLIGDLGLPLRKEVTGTLIVREKCLREELDKLSKLKTKRLKEFHQLHLQKLKYCTILNLPAPDLLCKVPTENGVCELKKQVSMLNKEIELRQKRLCMLKEELARILEITETPVEIDVLTSKEDGMCLSDETFKTLEQIVAEEKRKQTGLEIEKTALIDKLAVLWDLLKVDAEDKELFLSIHTDCRVSSLNAIKKEVARCEEIKMRSTSKYVDALKEELSSLLEMCFISESQWELPISQKEDAACGVLETYDNEVRKWRKFYHENEHILLKIKKWLELWDLMIALEDKANDPNRFKNRGGSLLQEDRQRKKLQKDLPALEKEIFLGLENYEKQTGSPFLSFGGNFRLFVAKQREDREVQKENEKITKQNLRARQLDDRGTSRKRPFPGSDRECAGKATTSKLFKSSVGAPVCTTQNLVLSKPIPSRLAKMQGGRNVPRHQSGANNKKKTTEGMC